MAAEPEVQSEALGVPAGHTCLFTADKQRDLSEPDEPGGGLPSVPRKLACSFVYSANLY